MGLATSCVAPCSSPSSAKGRGRGECCKDAGERIDLLGEIREMLEEIERFSCCRDGLEIVTSGGSFAEAQKRDTDVHKQSLEDLRKTRSLLEVECTRISKQQEEEMSNFFRKSTVRLATPQDSFSLPTVGARLVSCEAAREPPTNTMVSKSALQLALEDPLVLLTPELLCNVECSEQDGLKWDLTWSDDAAGPKDEGTRRTVRLNTRNKVARELGLSYFGEPARRARRAPPHLRSTTLYCDGGSDARAGAAPAGGLHLLGRYDVCCVRACADLDRKWNFIKGDKPDFWVAHAAAVNIGESADAADFEDFRKLEGAGAASLDEQQYVEAMGRIMDNIVTVCSKLGIRHMVFFPFGMGAFLRHLGAVDTSFSKDEEMLRLRRAVAARMVKSWAQAPEDLRVHLCLQFGSAEAQRNADAFLRALVDGTCAAPPATRDRVVVIPEGDCLDVGSHMALRSDRVMVVNGANRQLLGNHWFNGRAKMAIDENLHRRSWRLSAISYLLNEYDGEEFCPRQRDTLANRVRELGGSVVDL